MSRTEVSISMPEGDARAFVFKPDTGQGPWPGAVFYMDAPAIRPAMFEMAQRLANLGYLVLLPDMFWRLGPYDPIDVAATFGDPEARKAFGAKFMTSTDPEKGMADTGAFLDFLSAQPQVKPGKIGVTGYCMGASAAFRAAGTYPERIAAAGCFHGSNLATDAADSPHLLAPKIKAKVLVAGGDKDRSFDEAQKDRLAGALTAAGVDAEVTIYEGALHGYAPPDMPVYNREASERHWRELAALFETALK